MTDKKKQVELMRAEMWETFFEEVEDLLEKLESQLLDIENEQANSELIAGLFRTMHTFKGTAGMMGLINIQDLAHGAEDVMDMVRNGVMELTSDIVDRLFQTLDTFSEANQVVKATRKDIERSCVEELIAEFHHIIKAHKSDDSSGNHESSDGNFQFGIIENNNTEIDNEYVQAFFELVWEDIKLSKNILSKAPSLSKGDLEELSDIVSELLHAANHIGLHEADEELESLLEIIKKNSYKSITMAFNNLSHSFWDIEDQIESGEISLINDLPNNIANDSTSADKSPAEKLTGLTEALFETTWDQMSALRKLLEDQSKSHQDLLTDGQAKTTEIKALFESSGNASLIALLAFIDTIDIQLQLPEINRSSIGKALSDLYSHLWEIEDALSAYLATLPPDAESREAEEAQDDTPEGIEGIEEGIKETAATGTHPTEELTAASESQNIIETDSHENIIPFSSPEIHAKDLFDTTDTSNSQVFIEDYIENLQTNLTALRAMMFDGSYKNRQAEYSELIRHNQASSEQLDLYNIADIFAELLLAFNDQEQPIDPNAYDAFEIAIFEHIAQLLDTYGLDQQEAHSKSTRIKQAFMQWHADKSFLYLSECMQAFRSIESELHISLDRISSTVAEQAIQSSLQNLKWLTFACQYYQATSLEATILHVKDFFMRAQTNPYIITLPFIEKSIALFLVLGQQLDSLVEFGQYDEDALTAAFDPLAEQVSNNNNQLIETATHFLQAAQVPEPVLNNLNNDELEKISNLLNANQQIYLLFTDLESDEEIAISLTERLSCTDIEIVTSITDYIDEQSVFYFIISATSDNYTLLNDINNIDPNHQCSKLTLLTNTASNSQQQSIDQQPLGIDQQQLLSHVTNAQSILGQLISIKSNMQQTGENLSSIDIFHEIDCLLSKRGYDWKKCREEVRQELAAYETETRGLLQAQQELALNLDKLQEHLDSIGTSKSDELIKPLLKWYRSQQQPELSSPLYLDYAESNISIQSGKFSLLAPLIQPLIKNLSSFLVSCLEQLRSNTSSEPNQQTSSQTHKIDQSRWVVGFMPKESSFIFYCKLPLETVPCHLVPLIDQQGEDSCHDAAVINELFKLFQLEEVLQNLTEHHFHVSADIKDGYITEIKIAAPSDQHILDGIVVESQSNTFIFPIQFIKRIVNLSESEIISSSANDNQPMLKIGEELIPIKPLMQNNTSNQSRIALVLEYLNSEAAILVDELVGIRQVLTSPTASILSNNNAIMGMAVLGRDSVGMVVNTSALTH